MKTNWLWLFAVLYSALYGSLFISFAYDMTIDAINTPNAQIEPFQRSQIGTGSWYDYRLDGIEWSKTHSTCASRTAKRYSTITVTNIENGKSVKCFVNDYIEHPDRIVDLSSYAFSQIADLRTGIIKIKINHGR